jgi:hypothetical protein
MTSWPPSNNRTTADNAMKHLLFTMFVPFVHHQSKQEWIRKLEIRGLLPSLKVKEEGKDYEGASQRHCTHVRMHQRLENVKVWLLCHTLQHFCLHFVTRVWQFNIFSSCQNSVSKIKNIVANLLNVDKDKKLLSEINSCIQFVWNAFQVL